MFKRDKETKQFDVTRGDAGILLIRAETKNEDTGEKSPYTFKVGDVVRFKVFKAKDCGCVELQKDVIVTEEKDYVTLIIERDDTKIGELINKPRKYWYEIELNPDTFPQTIVGYDLEGEKVFMLYPEGDDTK